MSQISEKELISMLGRLKQIEPPKEWVVFCREKLASQMGLRRICMEVFGPDLAETRNVAQKPGFFSFLKEFTFSRLVLRPVAIMAVIFFLVSGSGLFAISRAKGSLPGDNFYPVKIALEQARLLTTTSAEGKAELRGDIMAIRLQELNQILGAEESPETKQPKIAQAVSTLQRHLLSVKDELPGLSQKAEASKVIAVARKIDASAIEAGNTLSQAMQSLSLDIGQDLSEKITEAADEAEKTSTKALEVMVRNQTEEGKGEILAKIDEKIQKTEQRIKELGESVAMSATSSKTRINASIILDESDKAIVQARESLGNNDMVGAFETIKAASEMVKSAEKLVENAPVTQPEQQVPSGQGTIDQNATGTPPVINIPAATSSPTSFIEPVVPATTTAIVEIIIITPTVQGAGVSRE